MLVAMVRGGVQTDKNGGAKDHKVLKYLNNIHCSNQQQMYDYKYSKVKDALNQGIPVIIGGYRDKKNNGGHYWVADGYLDRYVTESQTITYMYIIQNDNGSEEIRFVESPTSTTNHYELLHINWGWSGRGNGLYSTGVFNTDKQMMESCDGYFHTSPSEGVSDKYYNKCLEMITDIKPRY